MQRYFTQTFGVVGAIIEKDGKILLIQENLEGLPDDNKWSHPAGWIDLGEDPIAAVKREVLEESGYEFAPEFLLGIYSIVRRDQEKFWGSAPHAIKLIFRGHVDERSKKELIGDTKGAEWFLPEEIYAMDSKALRDGDIKQMARDYFAGKRYPLDIIAHTIIPEH